jgi:hypothetical protein
MNVVLPFLYVNFTQCIKLENYQLSSAFLVTLDPKYKTISDRPFEFQEVRACLISCYGKLAGK